MKSIQNITIIGAGLMGASLALALINTGKYKNINAVVKNNNEKNKALKLGCFNNVSACLDKKIIERADLIIIATPVSLISEFINKIYPLTKNDCIITDVGSVKSSIFENINSACRKKYIGSHPMTGSEKNGMDFADAALYENAVVIITQNKHSDLKRLAKLKQFWQTLKCNIKIIDTSLHDLIVGYISHLPHITAAALVNTAGSEKNKNTEILSFAGGGFRDTTRIAASNADLWTDICISNKQFICAAIDKMINNLNEFKTGIFEKNKILLLKQFNKAARLRETIPKHLKDLISISCELVVNVPDKPGILGKLTTLLGEHSINIKHIEVLFVREGESGAIKLGFKDNNATTAAYKLLKNIGYDVFKKN